MQQVIPGVFHYTGHNEAIDAEVSSYLVDSAAALIDPITPAEGLDALPVRPQRILLSSGHHLRHAAAIAEHFGGTPILASPQALEHLGAAGRDAGVRAWEPGGAPQVAPGITALSIGVLAADEGALHIDAGPGALLLADAVHHGDGDLAFFPNALLGDDPDAVKQGLNAALRGLLASLEFDALLFAHGEPIASGGHAALERFTQRGD